MIFLKFFWCVLLKGMNINNQKCFTSTKLRYKNLISHIHIHYLRLPSIRGIYFYIFLTIFESYLFSHNPIKDIYVIQLYYAVYLRNNIIFDGRLSKFKNKMSISINCLCK